ncbi:MAG: S-methyl-5-thioribose-1-phosphate isomerase [Candidatus Omnitrophota bacterium]
MKFKTISFDRGKLKLLDQNALPLRQKYVICRGEKEVFAAIKDMTVRGAPLIGITAAFGVVLSALNAGEKDRRKFLNKIYRSIDMLKKARPTAVNLFWALERMKSVLNSNLQSAPADIKQKLIFEAERILKEDEEICLRIGRNGAALIRDGDSILVHCNAGALATGGIGTALGIIYCAKSEGKKFTIHADETRPRLQGARLTCWELGKEGLDPILNCDTTAAVLMREGRVKKIFVGADRVALNGDTANKIGTYNLAVLAHYHKVPFYVAAPVSTIDFKIKSGREIPIEERDKNEVVKLTGKFVAPKNVKVYSPAFDVTPNELITAIITEKGIIKPPFATKIKNQKAKCDGEMSC